MQAGVAKSGSPISMWIMFTPVRCNACARSSTSMTRKEVTSAMREAGEKVDMPVAPVKKIRVIV